MDELATKAALKEEHDDDSDTDDMPLLEDIYDTFDDDNSSLGEKMKPSQTKPSKNKTKRLPRSEL